MAESVAVAESDPPGTGRSRFCIIAVAAAGLALLTGCTSDAKDATAMQAPVPTFTAPQGLSACGTSAVNPARARQVRRPQGGDSLLISDAIAAHNDGSRECVLDLRSYLSQVESAGKFFSAGWDLRLPPSQADLDSVVLAAGEWVFVSTRQHDDGEPYLFDDVVAPHRAAACDLSGLRENYSFPSPTQLSTGMVMENELDGPCEVALGSVADSAMTGVAGMPTQPDVEMAGDPDARSGLLYLVPGGTLNVDFSSPVPPAADSGLVARNALVFKTQPR